MKNDVKKWKADDQGRIINDKWTTRPYSRKVQVKGFVLIVREEFM